MTNVYTIVYWDFDGAKHFEDYYFTSFSDAKKYLEKKRFEYIKCDNHFKSKNFGWSLFAVIRAIPKYEEDE
ncbi:hypothetical protein MUA52_08345 [Staphylococcus agnetis]|uniref:hypothetical protein n=1 Tax=Staphylococcus agnetis TaxID=985762 RepID=UPI0021CEAC1A|nr:hypothetical protein [Staphylococcus agnetis]UXU63550.1 hypothetical protein MUA84_08410 [Staphylococcus agnetis]UXU65832.1 hypothetical protein MUA52_08345 [Staphylococcus agnetis]